MSTRAVHVGIDLGTTRTSAAVVAEAEDDAVARTVRLGQTGDTASSAVFVTDDALAGPHGLLHGDAAERRGVGEPTRLLRETKRRVGDDIPLVAAGRSFRPDELYARSVAWVVQTVAEQEGGHVASVTVTVPATWGEHRRRTVAEALTACGVTASLVTEPAAAAAHYCATHDVPVGAVLAVYDFGGGTFDLAFVRHGERDDTVIHSAGIAELGGADFDDAVFAHVVSSLDQATPVGSDPVALSALRRECVNAKEALSFDPDATIPVLHCGASIRLVRAEFETMIDDEIARTVALFADARADAGLADAEIHAIVMSGGTSRIPRVAQQLSQAFDLPLKADADPKAVVALGAARLGARAARPAPVAAPHPAPLPAFPARWKVAVAATAACAAVAGGVAFGSSMSAALPAGIVAAPAGNVRALFEAPDALDSGTFAPLLMGAGGVPVASEPIAAPEPVIAAPVPAPLSPIATPSPVPRNRLTTPTAPKPKPKNAPSPHSGETGTAAPGTRITPALPVSAPVAGGSGSEAPHSGVLAPTTPTGETSSDDPAAPVGDPSPTTAPDPTPDPEPTGEPQPDPTTDPEPEPTTPPVAEPEPTSDPQPTTEPEPVSPDPQPEPTATPDPSPGAPEAE